VYAATGSLKEASERTGISYSAVRVAAHRHDWKSEVKAAAEMVQRNVTTALGSARLSLEERSKNVREKHAIVAEKAAEKLSEMDADELLLTADTALKYAKHAGTVFGWQSTGPSLSVRLDVIAQSGPEAPVIDI
jgi:GGDEF domain-containing protein